MWRYHGVLTRTLLLSFAPAVAVGGPVESHVIGMLVLAMRSAQWSDRSFFAQVFSRFRQLAPINLVGGMDSFSAFQ